MLNAVRISPLLLHVSTTNSCFSTPPCLSVANITNMLLSADCDNQLENGGGPAPDGGAGCNMACSGNAAETCGGSDRLDLYQYA